MGGSSRAWFLPGHRCPLRIDRAAVWADLDQLAAEIGARWPEGVTAAEAVADGPSRAMRVVDASVWVARLVPQDVQYEATRRWLEATVARGGRLVSPILLLSEVSGAIARRTGDAELAERAVGRVLRVSTLGLVPTDPRLGRLAAQLAAELSLRGADALYVALAVHLQAPLVTWNRQQLERAGARVTVYTPDTDPVRDLRWGESRLNEAAAGEYGQEDGLR